MAATQPFRVRPGRPWDTSVITSIYQASFAKEPLTDFLFPTRATHQAEWRTFIYRLFQRRYWTPGFELTMLEDARGRDVGFSWWKRPLTFRERWFSLYSWIAPLARLYVDIKNLVAPVRGMDQRNATAYHRTLAGVEPGVLNTQRRCDAWYLSTLAIEPAQQGKGLGRKLLMDGLARVDKHGVAAWLVGVVDVDDFYARYGFKEVARCNVGDLAEWEGGTIMFRE